MTRQRCIKIVVPLALAWTVFIGLSFSWNQYLYQEEINWVARNEAHTIVTREALYRQWNVANGGVYVETSEQVRPNESLSHVPERDVVTPSGRVLTLVHAPFMIKAVYGQPQALDQAQPQVKSLEPLMPDQQADAWEAKALGVLAGGAKEYYEVVEQDGSDHLRLMRQLKADRSCLAVRQDVEPGAMVAGLSLSLPMAPFREAAGRHAFIIVVGHLVLLMAGFAGLGLGVIGLHKREAERRQANAETQRLYSELDQIFQAAGNGLWVLDKQGKVIRANRGLVRLAGYATEHEIINKACFEIFPCQDYGTTNCCLNIVFDSGQRFVQDKEVVDANNNRIRLQVTSTPFRAPDNSLIGVVQNYDDVTTIKKSEEQARRAEQEWERTFAAIGDVVTVQDREMRITKVNAAAAVILQTTPEALLGKYCYEIFRGIGQACPECPVVQSQTDLQPHIAEIAHLNLHKTFLVSASPILDENGEIAGVAHVAKDITPQKQLEMQLQQAQKMEAIGTLAGGVAHDFNNVLTAIMGYLHLAMEGVDPSSQAYQDLQEVLTASQRAEGLVRQLLLFSRKEPMKRGVLQLSQQVESLFKMLGRLIGEDITMVKELDPELWMVEGDAGKIDQVVMNLAVNGRDAMPDGGSLQIATNNVIVDAAYCRRRAEARVGKFVRLTVTDTGTGMDAATMDHIFEPFFSTKKAGRGTGLGLAVVYGIVKDHRGWMTVQSAVGQGSTFKVYLPAVEQSNAPTGDQGQATQTRHGRGERILLVEDEEAVMRVSQRALDSYGYSVITATSAKEAFAVFSRDKDAIDLVFSDVVLPDKNGFELVQDMLACRPDLAVILCSGYTDQKSQWQMIRDSGVRFLQKPFPVGDLLDEVRDALYQGKQQHPRKT